MTLSEYMETNTMTKSAIATQAGVALSVVKNALDRQDTRSAKFLAWCRANGVSVSRRLSENDQEYED